MNNFHSPYTGSTTFTAADMNPVPQALDRAITYLKNIIVHSDAKVGYEATTGQVVWEGPLRITFTTDAGVILQNTCAAGGVVCGSGQIVYLDLVETNGAEITAHVATVTLGSASTTLPYNRIVLGYRNIASDNFYPVYIRIPFTSTVPGSASIATDTDVSLTTPAQGDVLVYNATSEMWENSDALTEAISDIGDIDTALATILGV